MVDRRLARRVLDERLRTVRSVHSALTVPRGGWIKAIRESLGMTAEELASRLGVADSTVIRLESSETRRTVQLDTLMRAASALDCEVVYALVPHHTLEEAFQSQAERQAERQVLDVAHTMALEDQTPAAEEQQAMISELADDLVRSGRVRWRV